MNLFSLFTRSSGIGGYNVLGDFVILLATIISGFFGNLLPTGTDISGNRWL
jgi:hypothetical protein